MKALVKYAEGPGNLELRDVPVPVPAAGEVLVRVDTCGICGTDLKIRDGHFPCTPPVIVGHEFSGTVAETGAGVTGWKTGDRVVAEQHVGHCGSCEYCLTGRRQFCPSKRSPGYYSDGAFTGYIAVEASLLHRVPENVNLERAALAEPMAVAAYAILGKAGVRPGEFVVILGTGPIALLALQMVRAAGAARVVTTGLDADEALRFDAARRFGADGTVNVQKEDPVEVVKELSGGRMADLVIDLTGSPAAIRGGFDLLKKDGRFCAVGLPPGEVTLPWAEVVLKAGTVFFSYSSDYTSWERCLDMLSRGTVKTAGFTDHIFGLKSWDEAFDLAASGKALKVMIKSGEE
jgi:L-iditol 2-dehydrogenase